LILLVGAQGLEPWITPHLIPTSKDATLQSRGITAYWRTRRNAAPNIKVLIDVHEMKRNRVITAVLLGRACPAAATLFRPTVSLADKSASPPRFKDKSAII
jgi:hypothetical protein